MFFAEPEYGSELATFADYFSLRHWQMRQLRKGSDLLTRIQKEWKENALEELIKIVHVKGGQDAVLPRGKHPANVLLFADKDHRSIVKPQTLDDGSYLAFRDFVISSLNLNSADQRKACLFDVYQPEYEPYYVQRKEDFFVQATLGIQNIWLFGRSGVGKTAALMRAFSRIGGYRIVSLGHYTGSTVHALYYAFYVNLLPENEKHVVVVEQFDWPDLPLAIKMGWRRTAAPIRMQLQVFAVVCDGGIWRLSTRSA